MAGHKSTALVTLKLQYPVGDFKHQGGKLRIGLDPPPAAECLPSFDRRRLPCRRKPERMRPEPGHESCA